MENLEKYTDDRVIRLENKSVKFFDSDVIIPEDVLKHIREQDSLNPNRDDGIMSRVRAEYIVYPTK